jgi:hypothetical protein
MQQRRLRLGDIVDDYCPRERRITNHAIVAMIEDEVKQTRCTTCDADHEYKQARIPAQRRKKDAPAAPGPEGLAVAPRRRPAADSSEPVDAPAMFDTPSPVQPESDTEIETATESPSPDDVPLQAAPVDEPAPVFEPSDDEEPHALPEDDGPVHRRLIRATLPRPEGQAPERKTPEFTMHQREANGNRAGGRHRRGQRSGQMRAAQGNGQGQTRFGGQRQGQGSRQGSGGHGHVPRHGSGHGGQHGNRQGGGQGQPGQQRQNRGGRKRGR